MRVSNILFVVVALLCIVVMSAAIYASVDDWLSKRRCWESGGGVLYPHSESKWRCTVARPEAE